MKLSDDNSQLPDRSIVALVVDRYTPGRIGLRVLLQRQPWTAKCVLADDQSEAVRLARDIRPDVAIVDVSGVGPFAAALASPLRDAHPGIQIVLSSRAETLSIASPRAIGAVAVLQPTDSADEIVGTVRAALLSQPPAAVQAAPTAPALTSREQAVLLLLSTGATNHEIAAQLHLSNDSIKKYATAVYRKLGVRNRTEAARRAPSLLGTT